MSTKFITTEFDSRSMRPKHPTPHFKSCKKRPSVYQSSISGVTTPGSKAFSNSCLHGMDVVLKHLLRDCHPLLLQELEKLGTINRCGVIVPDPAPKNVPQMFYGCQIGRSGRPVHSHNLLTLQLIPDHPGAVRRRVVVL